MQNLVKLVTRDPAMLIYLDGRRSTKYKPNENYARELMELFTMSIGHYTKQDVAEAARALAGRQLDGLEAVFKNSRHDAGEKTFLGQTGLEDRSLPNSYSLRQNYPNPFNGATRIDYGLPRRAHVRLELFNSLGRRIRTLVNAPHNAGAHSIRFNAADLPSGVYFYQLIADNFREKRRMMLVR
ncbi:hypothetical protein DRI50_06410 [candidate division KSB1 bacterium]|nr:MAG: hypothetical protein DRI50_06410 [candidate division KSB1 bacterium]